MTRKEALKAAYKLEGHRMRAMGVYQIKNQVNGKAYLNASSNLEGAIARDRQWLDLGSFMNSQLQAEWKAFGAEAFKIEVLERLTPTDDPRNYAEELALLLEVWMDSLQPYDARGYVSSPRR